MHLDNDETDPYADCCPHCGFCGDPHPSLCMDCLPRYQHDCENDVYLGQFEQYDLYVATPEHHGNATYIARESDEPSDYQSGAVFVGKLAPITEAHRLATVRGIALTNVPEEYL